MHELAVTEDVLRIVLKHAESNNARKVVGVRLRIGELRDIVDEWMQRFFDYVSKGTIAEGAKLKIKRTPIVLRCECEKTFAMDIEIFREHLEKKREITCPRCKGTNTVLLSGREFDVQGIEMN